MKNAGFFIKWQVKGNEIGQVTFVEFKFFMGCG